MPVPIEDYALLSDAKGAALVSREGSIDWLCLPRFDSPAVLAALLGTPEHGRWLLAPDIPVTRTRRSYRSGSMVLETTFHTAAGDVMVTDALQSGDGSQAVLRVVTGLRGRVPMRLDLTLRPEYGSVFPWVQHEGDRVVAMAGPDAFSLDADVPVNGGRWGTVAEFTVDAGTKVSFALQWHPSNTPVPPPLDAAREVERTDAWWRYWSRGSTYDGRWRDAVERSLITLKALTYLPTGGIIAAPTTSLPEDLGGHRNWDYRYTWVRDAAFTLQALLHGGFVEEARAWRDWLLRAAAGHPAQLQVLYGVAGERRIPEAEIPWRPGYGDSRPVRIGNAAHGQFQLDIYGEVLDALAEAHQAGLDDNPLGEHVGETLLEFLESAWQQPDDGIWEVRGGRRHFTHSKIMSWVAADRACRVMSAAGSPAAERWRHLRDAIRKDVLARGVDDRGVFVQSYGSDRLDAALLTVPLVGFLPASDPRVRATVEAVGKELTVDGFVLRYAPDEAVEGVRGDEGAFLLTTFWFVENLAMLGHQRQAEEHFERLLAIRNDVGLLAEEYDPVHGRMLGNFPQAFSHVALVNAAHRLDSTSRELPLARAGLTTPMV